MKKLQQQLFYQYINHKMTPQFKIILEDKYHYDIEAIKKMISSYVKKYATDEEKKWYKARQVLNRIKPDIIELESIYEFFRKYNWSPSKDSDFVKKSPYTIKQLRKYAETYAIYVLNQSANDIKISSYKDQEKKESLNLIKEYLKSNLSKEDFLKGKKMSSKTFQSHIDNIKKYPNIYKAVLEYPNEILKQHIKKYSKDIFSIIYLLKSGIENNGQKRPFDSLDYYTLFDIDIHTIYSVSSYLQDHYLLSKNDYNQLKKFIYYLGFKQTGKNKFQCVEELSDIQIQNFLTDYNEKDCNKDKDNLPIKGTGKIITAKEKSKIIDYLKANNIIISPQTINDSITRIINGYMLETTIKKQAYPNIYYEQIQKTINESYKLIEPNVYTLITYLHSGIKENNITRSFDIIDYYEQFNISIRHILLISAYMHHQELINNENYRVLKVFLHKIMYYQNQKPYSINDIENHLNQKAKTFINNKPISISFEAKLIIFNYLKYKCIPINDATFKSGCLRYLKGYPLEYPTQSIMVKKIN